MGSSYLEAGSRSGGDSLNGLKFGQKIYFEDVGGGGSASEAIPPPPGSSSSSAEMAVAFPARKGKGGTFQGGQPPRCQVEGCNVDLTGAKAYYCRHKVCGMHSKYPMVIVAGMEQRFCQQCSRFHQLPEFDQCKRSCRRRLAGHNERRRKPPPSSLLAPRYPEDTNRVGSFLDFSYPNLHGREVWPGFRMTEHRPSKQVNSAGNYLPDLIQRTYDALPTNVVCHGAQAHHIQSSSASTMYSGSDFSPAETFAAVSGTGCALSLLSNQQWDPRNRLPSINNLVDDSRTHASLPNQFMSNAWGVKDYGDTSNSHNLSLHQFYDPAGAQYMELGQPRGTESSSHRMNWTL